MFSCIFTSYCIRIVEEWINRSRPTKIIYPYYPCHRVLILSIFIYTHGFFLGLASKSDKSIPPLFEHYPINCGETTTNNQSHISLDTQFTTVGISLAFSNINILFIWIVHWKSMSILLSIITIRNEENAHRWRVLQPFSLLMIYHFQLQIFFLLHVDTKQG